MAVGRIVAICTAGVLAAGALFGGDHVLRTPSLPESQLLRKVEPEYPAKAVANRIQGDVRFTGFIGKDGRIDRLELISGHPLLVAASRKAARQWIYRPYILGGMPVRVITNIELHFKLDAYGRPISPVRQNGLDRRLALHLPVCLLGGNRAQFPA